MISHTTDGTRPSMLMISHRVPFPVHNGQSARTYNILRELARHFDITLVCFDNHDESRPEMAMSERRQGVQALVREMHVFPIPQEHSRVRFVRDHTISVLTRTPYTFPLYDSAPFRRLLTELLRIRHFDIVHLESGDLINYAEMFSDIPVACTHHNVESELLLRRANAERNALACQYIKHQAALVCSAEERLMPRVALNVAVSDADMHALVATAPTARVVNVPNGVDVELYDPALFPGERKQCAFLGGTNWFPNRDALDWYGEKIVPLLASDNIITRWAGFSTADERLEFSGREGLELTGYVDDVRQLLATAACFVVPLRVGGGTRLKILEAWAMAAPVVSTSVGCEGLRTAQGENILIADSPEEFAAAVKRVLHEPELAQTLGDGGRKTAVDHYSWTALGDKLSNHYFSILRNADQTINSSSQAAAPHPEGTRPGSRR